MTDDRPSEPLPRPRRRRVLLIAAIVVAVLLTTAIAILHFNRHRLELWLAERIEAELAEALGGEASIGALEVHLARLEVELGEVYVQGPLEGGGTLEGRVRSARVSLPWRGLAALKAGRVWLSQVRLVEPVVTIEMGEPVELGAEAPTTSPPLDWRIDRLEITRGELRYGDRGIPIETRVENLEVDGTWARFRRALIGQLSTDITTTQPVLSRPFPLHVSGGYRLMPGRAELLDLEVGGPGLQIRVREAHLPLEPGLEGTATGQATADLGELSTWLRADLPALSGRLSGDIFVVRGQDGFQISGDYELRDAVFGPVETPRVSAHVDYFGGRLTLSDSRATILGGTVTGEGSIRIERPFEFDLRARGEDVDVRSVVLLAGRDVPVASRARIDLDLSGIVDRVETWKGSAWLDAVAVDDASGLVPLSATARLQFTNSKLRVQPVRIEGADAVLELATEIDLSSGVPVGVFSVQGEFEDAARTQDSLVLAAGALGVKLPPVVLRPVTGRGQVEASMVLAGEPSVELTLRLERGGWGGVEFGQAEVDLRYDGHRIHVARAVLEGVDWRLEGDGEIDVEPFQVFDLDLQLEDFPLETGLTLLQVEADITGRVSAGLSLQRGPQGLEGTGQVEAREVTFFGEPIERAAARGEFRRNAVQLHMVSAAGPGFEIRGEGSVDLNTWSGSGQVDGRIGFSELRILEANKVDAEGELRFEGPLSFSPDGPEGRLRISGPDWRVAGFELGPVVGEAVLATGGVDLQLATGERFGLTLESHLDWGGTWPVTAVLYLDGTQVDYEIPGFEKMWGRVSGRVILELPLVDPDAFLLRGTIETGEFHVGAAVIKTREGIPFVLADGRLDAGPATIGGTDTELEVSVGVYLADRTLDARCSGGIGLNIVSAIWPELRASGRLDVDLRLGGTVDSPDFRGTLGVNGGRVRILGFPAPLNDLIFAIQLEGQGASLEQFRARLGGGEVTGSGSASFEGLVPESYELLLDVANVRVEFPKGFRAAYEGRITFRGDEGRATLGGDLNLLRGAYSKEIDFTSMLLRGSRDYDVTQALEVPVTVVLDIDLRADGNVWLRNSLAEVEAGLDLHIGGEIDRPEVTGQIWVYEGGKIFFRRVDYEIESGAVELTDPGRIDPYIDLRARTRVSDYEVRMHVEGTLDELNYQLTSDPPLSAPDIIALLATGRTLEEFGTTSAATGFTGDVVANYFAGALTGSFEKQMEDLLRLERVWIDPLLVEGIDPTARVTLGKEVADDLFLVYSFDVGGPTGGEQYRLYQVDWQATRKFRVVVGSSTTGGVSGDVRYTTRFMGRKGRQVEDTPVPAEAATVSPERRTPHEGDPVLSVVIEIPKEEGARALLDVLPVRAGDGYQRSALFEGSHRIRRRLVRDGYIEAEVKAQVTRPLEDEPGVHLSYEIEPGPIVKIVLQGFTRKKDRRRIRERLEQLWIDSVFQEEIYEDAVEVILEYLHENGFYAADVVHEESVADGVKTVTFIADPGDPVKVSSVTIEGRESLSEEQVARQMVTRSSTAMVRRLLVPRDLAEDAVAIANLYRDNGFLAVRVDPPEIRLAASGLSAQVILTIREGPRFTISHVGVPPDLPFSAELMRQWVDLEAGDVFSPRGLIEAESALRAQLDRQGYPDARVKSETTIEGTDVRVDFRVNLGDLNRLGEIRVEGNRATKNRVIIRTVEDHLKPGDLISRNALLDIQHDLYRLGLFRSVRLSTQPLGGDDPTLQTLVVRVRESPPIGLMVGAGYDTEGGVGGVFSISHTNPGGRNRTVAFQGRGNRIEQSLQLALDDPRFFGKRLSSLTNLLWRRRERPAFTDERRAISFRVEQRPKPRWLQFVRYSFQTVDLSDITDEQAAREEKLEDLTLGSLTYSRAWTTRRDLFVATDGSLVSGDVSLFAKALGSETEFLKVYLQGTKDFPIKKRQTFVTAVRLGLEWPYGGTRRVPLSERFFAGGSQSIRGFPLDSVGPVDENGDPLGGQALLILNEEYRFPIWGPVRGVLFYDLGTVWPTVDSIDLSELRHVLGTGIRLETPIGPVRFEYGRNLDRREGESKGEFFFSIGSLF